MNTNELNNVRILLRMCAGDATESMESAKKLIGSKVRVPPALLDQIASKKQYRRWSRIAAVYAIGFLNYKVSVGVLVSILGDGSDDVQVRAHAAEALGNIGDESALPALRQCLLQKEPRSIKRWSIYALSEIGTDRARKALEEFAATRPTGVLGKELRSALNGPKRS
jgi:HEAT repeat protein